MAVVTFEVPSAPTIQVSEAEFTLAFHRLAKQAPAWDRPLETARRLFDVQEKSGTYLYEVRTRRLLPVAADNQMLGEVSEQEFVRDYFQWCNGSLGPGDCLRLLEGNRSYSAHARYATALAIGWGSALGSMRETLRGMVTPAAVIGTVFSAMAVYLMLWTVPEPFSKGIAAALTIWLIGYFGFDPLWRLAKAWTSLVDEADAALDFEALRKAGERFGERAGPGAARLLVLLTTIALGGSAGMASKGASLPGFSLASAQADGQLAVSLSTATAAESVLVGAQTVTITFAPGLWAMAAASPLPSGAEDPDTVVPDGFWRDRMAPTQAQPGTRKITEQKPSSATGEVYVRTSHYDRYGRLVGQTHYTTHGRPQTHTNPHHHVRDPVTGQVSGPRPGPFPEGQ